MIAAREIHAISYGERKLVFSLERRDRKTLEIGICPTMTIEVVAPIDAALDDIKAKVSKRASWICEQLRFFEQFQPTTPDETLDTGFFAPDDLPEPFVPIHAIRIEDAVSGERSARVR